MTTEECPERPKRRNCWTLTIILIMFASLCQQVTARIGETPKQCQDRYGKPVKTDKAKEELQYLKDEILITVRFYNGMADYISFETKRKVSPSQLQAFSDIEIQGLLKANGGARSWKRYINGSSANGPNIRNYGHATWWTTDGMLLAKQSGLIELIIVNKGNQRRFEEEEKAKKNKKLQGF